MKTLVDILKKTGAIKYGDFTLKSGIKSNIYVDMRRVICSNQIDYVARPLAELIYRHLGDYNKDSDHTLVGVPESGIALMQSLMVPYSNWNGGWVRASSKDHGILGQWAGSDLRDSCIIVEDVITSGGSILSTIKALDRLKPNCVKLIVCILNRGLISNIDGISVHSLLTLTDLNL